MVAQYIFIVVSVGMFDRHDYTYGFRYGYGCG